MEIGGLAFRQNGFRRRALHTDISQQCAGNGTRHSRVTEGRLIVPGGVGWGEEVALCTPTLFCVSITSLHGGGREGGDAGGVRGSLWGRWLPRHPFTFFSFFSKRAHHETLFCFFSVDPTSRLPLTSGTEGGLREAVPPGRQTSFSGLKVPGRNKTGELTTTNTHSDYYYYTPLTIEPYGWAISDVSLRPIGSEVLSSEVPAVMSAQVQEQRGLP